MLVCVRCRARRWWGHGPGGGLFVRTAALLPGRPGDSIGARDARGRAQTRQPAGQTPPTLGQTGRGRAGFKEVGRQDAEQRRPHVAGRYEPRGGARGAVQGIRQWHCGHHPDITALAPHNGRSASPPALARPLPLLCHAPGVWCWQFVATAVPTGLPSILTRFARIAILKAIKRGLTTTDACVGLLAPRRPRAVRHGRHVPACMHPLVPRLIC